MEIKIITTTIAIVILIIGAPITALATKTGSGCDLGPTQSECYDQFLKHAPQTALYKAGFAQGVFDGHHGILNNTRMDPAAKTVEEQILYSLGYSRGWLTTCKERGFDIGPDSGCQLSLDR